jgi:hypothetical protein
MVDTIMRLRHGGYSLLRTALQLHVFSSDPAEATVKSHDHPEQVLAEGRPALTQLSGCPRSRSLEIAITIGWKW